MYTDYWKSVELASGIVMDISEDGSVMAIEVPGASKIFSGELKRVIEVAAVAAN